MFNDKKNEDTVNLLPDKLALNKDGTLTISKEQLLGNSLNHDNFFVSSVSYTGVEGIFKINDNNTYTFAPNEHFNGNLALNYTINDGQGITTDIDINITTQLPSSWPTAGNTAFTLDSSNILHISPEQMVAQSVGVENAIVIEDVNYHGIEGIFTHNHNGSLSFASNQNFSGDITFSLKAINADGTSLETVTHVTADIIDIPPLRNNLAYSIDEDLSITFSQEQLLAFANDIEGDDLHAFNMHTENPSLVIGENADGSFTLVPFNDFNNNFDATFDISNGNKTITSNVNLTINPVTDLNTIDFAEPSLSKEYSFVQNEGYIQFLEGDLMTSLDIPLAEIGNFSIETVQYSGEHGTLIHDTDNSWSFWPAPDYSGEITLDISMYDGKSTLVNSIDFTVKSTQENASPPPEPLTESTDLSDFYTASPGGDLYVTIPEDLSNSSDIQYVLLTDLPGSAYVPDSLEDNQGNSIISGDLSKPIHIKLVDNKESDFTFKIAGFDSSDTIINNMSYNIGISVNISHDTATPPNDIALQHNNWNDSLMADDEASLFSDTSLTDFDETSAPDIDNDDYSALG